MLPDFTRIQDISSETAILAGLAALAFCFLLHVWRSETRIAALRRDNAELVRSLDSVIRSRPRETQPKPIARHSPKQLAREEAGAVPPLAPVAHELHSVVAAHAVLPLAGAGLAPDPAIDPARDLRVPHALARAIAEERLEISLQPIVAISEGEAVAFEAFASVELDDEERVHVRRLVPADALDVVDFDVSMFLASVQAARQRLGRASERRKLHLAVSEELLSSPEPLSEICAILTVHPAIVRSIVISLPSAARNKVDLLDAVRRLYDTGLSLALEHGPAGQEGTVELPPVEFLKIDADRLLSIAGDTPGEAPGRLAELWTDPRTRIVASSVTSEAQAMRLIDLGVDLMTGAWFSEPRLLHVEVAGDLAEAHSD